MLGLAATLRSLEDYPNAIGGALKHFASRRWSARGNSRRLPLFSLHFSVPPHAVMLYRSATAEVGFAQRQAAAMAGPMGACANLPESAVPNTSTMQPPGRQGRGGKGDQLAIVVFDPARLHHRKVQENATASGRLVVCKHVPASQTRGLTLRHGHPSARPPDLMSLARARGPVT